MDYVQKENVTMINVHKRTISEKKNLKITKKNKLKECIAQWHQIIANMFSSMAVSWFVHVKMYHTIFEFVVWC